MKRTKQFYTVCASTLLTLAAWGLINQSQVHADSQNSPATARTSQVSAAPSASEQAGQASSPVASASSTTLNPASSQVSQASPAAVAPRAAIRQEAAIVPVHNDTQADAVDVSWANPNMTQETFDQLKAQGVKHVLVQLTRGTENNRDAFAEQQLSGAYHAGLGVAVYHYAEFHDRNSALHEADLFANRAEQLHVPHNTLMIADVETGANKYRGVTNDLRAFFDRLSARGYWNHAVYTGLYFDSVYHVSSVVGRNRTWIAKYYNDHQATPYRIRQMAAAGYGAWQYTGYAGYRGGYLVGNYGRLDGSVDMGLFRNTIGNGYRQAGSLDTFKLNSKTKSLDVGGWFASEDSRGKGYLHVFLLSNCHEIARQRVEAGSRPDVKNAYYYLNGSEKSGFNAQFSLDNAGIRKALAQGSPITVIFRYSTDENGDHDFVQDIFPARSFKQDNLGSLDQFQIIDGALHVSGWHASDQSIVLPIHWLIIYDQSSHHELARKEVTPGARPDVQKAYPDLYGAAQSGYQADFNLADYHDIAAAIMHGDTLQVISRYSDDQQNGEGNKVNYWNISHSFDTKNAAWLDSFGLQGQNLHASGWYADDRSQAASHRYIILFDRTLGHELTRKEVEAGSRTDVARAYPHIANAAMSGFSVDFAINPTIAAALQAGHDLQILARYSDQANGEGDYCQNWFKSQRFTVNKACLDNFKYDPTQNKINVSGWHCADQAAGRNYHLDILWDATAGHELTRLTSPTVERTDVAQAYPQVYNSQHSGFSLDFDLTDAIKAALDANHNLRIIDRYAATADANENYVDYWFPARRL